MLRHIYNIYNVNTIILLSVFIVLLWGMNLAIKTPFQAHKTVYMIFQFEIVYLNLCSFWLCGVPLLPLVVTMMPNFSANVLSPLMDMVQELITFLTIS